MVTNVIEAPEGVGTKVHIVRRFAKEFLVEQIEREYSEFVPDARIVSKAHARVRFAGRTRDVANGPICTWLFEPEDRGTWLAFVVVEEDLGWWQRNVESLTAAVMAKTMHGMLEAIKTGVESTASSAA